jgi:hypothetical protein
VVRIVIVTGVVSRPDGDGLSSFEPASDGLGLVASDVPLGLGLVLVLLQAPIRVTIMQATRTNAKSFFFDIFILLLLKNLF